jgi:dephospho-CoA kinase
MRYLVAITGGIGVGKSKVASFFEDFGVPVYYSDTEAKRIMEELPHLKKSISLLLGTEAYLKNGQLNRAYIASEIFKDSKKLKSLNELVHKEVHIDFQTWVTTYDQKSSVPYLMYESALVFENGLESQFNSVILVTAPEALRIERIKIRDHRSEKEIKRIIMSQMSENDKIKKADFVINNQDLSLTLLNSSEIHNKIIIMT